MGIALTFILFFRLGESQLVKMAAPFFLDSVENGGLGYTTAEVGTIYGTIGVIMLTLGGILPMSDSPDVFALPLEDCHYGNKSLKSFSLRVFLVSIESSGTSGIPFVVGARSPFARSNRGVATLLPSPSFIRTGSPAPPGT